jgi:hypothetical protein
MKVSWDDVIPNIWKVMKTMFQTTNQKESEQHMGQLGRFSSARVKQPPQGIKQAARKTHPGR